MAAMETRQRSAEKDHQAVIAGLLRQATALQGGGTEISSDSLRESVETAVKAAIERLFTQFAQADDAKWAQVFSRARDGNADALSVIGHRQDAAQHPVCRQLLDWLGHQGRTGNDIRKRFDAPPYGWPTDAINGAIVALVAAGLVKASEHGAAVRAQDLNGAQIGKVTFHREGDVVSTTQRIQARKLLQQAGIQPHDGQEAEALPAVIAKLKALAASAGGDAPAPAPPDTGHLYELSQRTGNALILGCAEQREQLLAELAQWQQRTDQLITRRER